MNYWFTAASTFLLAGVGAWVTHRFVEPRLERVPWSKPDDIDLHEFALTADDRRGLRWALGGLVAALLAVALLVIGPLAAHEGPDGDPVVPYLDNVILLISLVFTVTGAAYGFGSRRFTRVFDVVDGMVRQMNTMGYVIVLAFFAYNALALFAYSGLGTLLAHLGATGLIGLGLQNTPMLLLVGFVLLAASVNLLIAGMTSKWLLLGPVFVPMLYSVNPAMTPDLVAAAFRVGDSVTNIITPMMVYAGVILAFARRWVPDFTLGQQIGMMIPYSLAFLASWTLFLMIWFWLGIPLGF
jgi:aminobenzoyl-glutamate transport protein